MQCVCIVRHGNSDASKVQKRAKKANEMCNFAVSDYKGKFLQGSHLDEWKILMLVHLFLDNNFSLMRALQLVISTKGPIRRSSLTRQVASLTRPKAILDESGSQ